MFGNTLWVEKYRPQTIKDCILPIELKKAFKQFVTNNDIPHLLLTGSPGIGKTTVAKALCMEMNCDYIVINGSDESGIDVLRNKIKSFASTISLSGGLKVVIIDEADYLNPQSTQPAMRSFMEEFSNNCRFILTCNYKKKIIPALISRCTVIEFSIPSSEKAKIQTQIFKRIIDLLINEKVDIDLNDNKKLIAEVIIRFFPDIRKIISEFQRYAIQNGKIDVGILSAIQEISAKELMQTLKSKNFSHMRSWVNENLDNEPSHIIRMLFDSLETYLEPASIPQAILILSEYGFKAAFVADQEINMTAMLINIMADCIFK